MPNAEFSDFYANTDKHYFVHDVEEWRMAFFSGKICTGRQF